MTDDPTIPTPSLDPAAALSDEAATEPAISPTAAPDEAAPAGEPHITLGLITPYLTLGPYMTLQEAVARLGRNPVGVVLDEDDAPLTVVTRETLQTLLGEGKDSSRARGRMGPRQQAREKREGVATTRTLVSLKAELPPLISADLGAPLAPIAAQVRESGAPGVLVHQDGKRAGVLLARALLRHSPSEE